MRACLLLAILPAIAACEAQPAPEPEPRPTANPVIIKAETDRKVLLSGDPRPGDFKVNFGEPFIGFENRGTRMAISQGYSGPDYRVVDVTITRDEGITIFRGSEGAIPGAEPFVLSIVRDYCRDQFSREETGYIAWLGTASDPKKARTCAARAR